MEDEIIMNTYAVNELTNLPDLFESPEELYIMLLDLVYTERFSCMPQYSAIVSYCMESNFLVDISAQLHKFSGSISPNQFVHGCLLCIVTLFAKRKYDEAKEFSDKLINDIQTQIQDYRLDEFLYRTFHVQLQMLKIFKQKPKNALFYINILQIMKSITEEALSDYVSSEASISQLAQRDLSISLAQIRLQFNAQYQSIAGFSIPLFSYGHKEFEKILTSAEKILKTNVNEQSSNTIFNYEARLIKFVAHLYCARIQTLLGDYQKANEHFIELWQLSPDDESYEESIAIYLDNFIRYAFGESGELSLLTKSPLYYVQNPRRLNLQVVAQAFETATQFSEMSNVNIKVIAYYYLAILNVLQQNYEQAISCLKFAKQHNEQQYKYPSEMVTLTYLPQMIDFDILSSLVMMGDAQVCSINLPNYFGDLLQQKSILLQLSQDRKSICMPLQCMLTLEQYYMNFDHQYEQYEQVIDVLLRSSLLDEKFGQSVGFCYCIEVDEINIKMVSQIYIFAEHIFMQLASKLQDKRSYFLEIATNCRKSLEFYKNCKDFKEQLDFLRFVTTDALVPPSPISQTVTEQLTNPLEIQCKQRNTLLQQVQKFLGKMDEIVPEAKQLNLMIKCMQSGPESAFGMSNSIKDLLVGQLVQAFKGKNLDTFVENMAAKGDLRTLQEHVLLGMFYNEQQKSAEAIELLSTQMYKEGQPKNVQQLYMHNIAKLHAASGNTAQALGIYKLLSEQFDPLYFNQISVTLDYALCLIQDGNIANVQQGLFMMRDKVNQSVIYKLYFIMFVLETFQAKGVLSELQTTINLSEFDLSVLGAADSLQLISGDITDEQRAILNNGFMSLMQSLDELKQFMDKPPVTKLQYNNFNLSLLKMNDFQKCLFPELGKLSVLCSDCFDSTQTVLYLVSLLVVLGIASGNESALNADVLEQFMKCVSLQPAVAQNLVSFVLQHNRYELAIELLQKVRGGKDEEIKQWIAAIQLHQSAPGPQPERVWNIASDHSLFTVQAGPFFGAIVVPLFPVVLPKIVDRQIFNPLGQFSFSFFIDSYIASRQSQVPQIQRETQAAELGPMTCVMLFDFYGFLTDTPAFQEKVQEQDSIRQGRGFKRVAGRQLTSDVVARGIQIGRALDNAVVHGEGHGEEVSRTHRPGSARPLLKIDKGKMFAGAGKQARIRPIRKFRDHQ